MRLLIKISLVPIFMLGSFSAFAWGEKGHDAIACIAQEHLTPRTQREVNRLLGDHRMAYWASWADALRSDSLYDAFQTWHYANTDEGYTYAMMPKNPLGDVVTATQLCIEQLKLKNQPDSLRALYLKLLIHFVGDMHCPMHLGAKGDLGGNLRYVVFQNSQTNLHKIWDSSLIDTSHTWSGLEWAIYIDNKLKRRERLLLQKGMPEEWVEDVVDIRMDIYANTPPESSLSWSYVDSYSPVIENQFILAGYRLAGLLNEIFSGRRR